MLHQGRKKLVKEKCSRKDGKRKKAVEKLEQVPSASPNVLNEDVSYNVNKIRTQKLTEQQVCASFVRRKRAILYS